LERLANRLDKISNTRNLILTIITSVLVVAVMGYLTQTLVYDVYGEANMPDTNFGYGYDDLKDAFDTLGMEGLQVWSQVHLLDLLFPLGYSFALVIGITMELNSLYPDDKRLRVISIVPLFAAMADYLENAIIASQIAVYPNLSPAIVAIASLVTITKWVLLGFGFGIVLLLLFVWIGKRLAK